MCQTLQLTIAYLITKERLPTKAEPAENQLLANQGHVLTIYIYM
jgi:hypothetical protein